MNSPQLTPKANRDTADDVLLLPASDSDTVAADLAAAPIIGWFRALAQWAEAGRTLDGKAVPRLTHDQATEVYRLLTSDESEDEETSAAFANAVLRWAMQVRVLRLYGGVLRTVKNAAELCAEPGLLWFRALNVLVRPDTAFTDPVGEYTGTRIWFYDMASTLGDFLGYCSPQAQNSVGDSGSDDSVHSRLESRFGSGMLTLSWLAEALGLVTRTTQAHGEAVWEVTGLGRVIDALAKLPYHSVPGEDDDGLDGGLCLIAQPDGDPEPGFVVKVLLLRVQGPVWRRLRIPGELTVEGLRLAIHVAFGWDDDHLHAVTAGPYTLAAPWAGLDGAIPSDLVTVTDLASLGVRELSYEYDLGASWKHTVTIEKVLSPGSVEQLACLGGAGDTPSEDGGDWQENDGTEQGPALAPEAKRVFDRDRITLALAELI